MPRALQYWAIITSACGNRLLSRQITSYLSYVHWPEICFPVEWWCQLLQERVFVVMLTRRSVEKKKMRNVHPRQRLRLTAFMLAEASPCLSRQRQSMGIVDSSSDRPTDSHGLVSFCSESRSLVTGKLHWKHGHRHKRRCVPHTLIPSRLGLPSSPLFLENRPTEETQTTPVHVCALFLRLASYDDLSDELSGAHVVLSWLTAMHAAKQGLEMGNCCDWAGSCAASYRWVTRRGHSRVTASSYCSTDIREAVPRRPLQRIVVTFIHSTP